METNPVPVPALRTLDGATVRCAFHTWSCSDHAAQAGGFDEHHRWPKAMGGTENQTDLLVLCSVHHRRQHALVRAYAEYGVEVRTVKWFSPLERETAKYAVDKWIAAGRPRVYWNVPAAAVVL